MAGSLRLVSGAKGSELGKHTIVFLELPPGKVEGDSGIEDIRRECACKHEQKRRVRHAV